MIENCQKMKNQKVGWRQISLERVTEHLQSSSIAHSKERKNHIGAPAPLVDFSSAFKPLNNKENGQSLFWSITHFGLSHENGILTISTRNMPQMIFKRSQTHYTCDLTYTNTAFISIPFFENFRPNKFVACTSSQLSGRVPYPG